MNLIHLLCLCNYSFRDIDFNLRFKIKRSILTSSMDFYQKVMVDPKLMIVKTRSIFHDLPTLSLDMNYNMKQYSGIKDFVKGFLYKQKLFYLKPSDIEKLKQNYGISDFELSIFYYFVRSDKESDSSKEENRTKMHNVLIVNDDQPVLVIYNPFQHRFTSV